MSEHRIEKAAATAILALLLSACTSTDAEPSASDQPTAETAREVASNLSQTQRTATSDDGRMICKRTQATGSKFHRKVCATKEEWDARAVEDRQTIERIQRSAGPGKTN